MDKHIQKDRSQFSELLYKSVIMNTDKGPVTEKVLNLILEIICLLTGEDCIIVKKHSERFAQDVSPGVSEEYWRTQNHCIEPSPNPLTHSDHSDQALHPPTIEVPVRCEDTAVYLSKEEWEYLEEHKEHYKEMIKKKYRLYSSRDESSNRNTSESCHIPPESQDCTEEDTWITQDYQMEPGDGIDAEHCKKEEIPADISRAQECVVNVHVTQDDERANLVIDCSSSKTTTNSVTILNTDVTLNEELTLPDSQMKHKGMKYPSNFVKKHTKRKTNGQRIQENMSERKQKYRESEKNVTNELDCISYQRAHNDEMDNSSKDQACSTNNSYLSTQQKPVANQKINRGKKLHQRSSPIFHQKIHTGEKIFQCSECGKSFFKKKYLLAHQKTHTGKKPFQCCECGKSFTCSSSLLVHQRIHTGEKNFVCSECGKSFYTRSNLLVHQIIHTQKPFSCSDCRKCFADKPALLKHQRIHTEETLFTCSECGKRYSCRSALTKHQKTHTGDKPCVCSECGKSFIYSSFLVVHQRIHTGEKPFVCSKCGKSFNQRSNLLTHQRVHTKKPFSCSDCGKGFTNEPDFVQHQMIHTAKNI